MNRIQRKSTPVVPKVTKVELSTKNIILRIVFFVFFLVLGVSFIIISLNRYAYEGKGWNTISISSNIQDYYKELSFNYYCGSNSENKKVTKIYRNSVQYIYGITSIYTTFDDKTSIKYINDNANNIVIIDQTLYDYLYYLYNKDSKVLYYQPIVDWYDSMFTANINYLGYEYYLPSNNIELFNNIKNYINSNNITLEFYGNNQVKLNISNEYKSYLDQYELNHYIGLGNYKSVICIDYISNQLELNNFNRGYISSKDGISKLLSKCDPIDYNLFGNYNGYSYHAGTIKSINYSNIIEFKNFITNTNDYSYILPLDSYSIHKWFNNDFENSTSTSYMLAFSNDITLIDLYYQAYNIYSSNNPLYHIDNANLIYINDDNINTDATLNIELSSYDEVVYKLVNY